MQADGLVSILAHELIETVSDPDGDAWYDAKGQENADKVSYSQTHLEFFLWLPIDPLHLP